MPCCAEFVGVDRDLLWYCCYCGDGPMNYAHTQACHGCGHYCAHMITQPCAYMVTPPDSPAFTSSHKGKKGAKDRRIREAAPTPPSVPSRLHPDDCDTVPAPKSDVSFDEPVEAYADGTDYLEIAIEPYIDAYFAAASCAAPTIDLTDSPAVISCAPGGQATSRGGKPPLQPASQRQSAKSNRRPSEKRGSGGRRDEQDDDEGAPNKRQNLGRKSQSDEFSLRKLACHFCKFNPSRFRHELSCKKGFTGSELRAHLTRPENPHSLDDCDICLQVFSKDEKDELDAHRKAKACTHRDIVYPVEGVGSRLRSEDSETVIPKFAPGQRASQEEVEAWWKKTWILLFGPKVPIPENIYHDEQDNLRRSNDWSLLGWFRDRLENTLQSELPQGMQHKAFRHHLVSLIEAETNYFRGRVGVGLLPPMVVQPKRSPAGEGRRKSGNGSNEENQTEPENPMTDIFEIPEHMGHPSSPDADVQPHEDTPTQIPPVDSVGMGSQPAPGSYFDGSFYTHEGVYDTDTETARWFQTNPMYSENPSPFAPSFPAPTSWSSTPVETISPLNSAAPTQEEHHATRTHALPPKKVRREDESRLINVQQNDLSLNQPPYQHDNGERDVLRSSASVPSSSLSYDLPDPEISGEYNLFDNSFQQSYQTFESEPYRINVDDFTDQDQWGLEDGVD